MKKTSSIYASIVAIIGIFIFSNIVVVAQNGGGRSADMTIDQRTRSEVVENLAKNLEESYVFPEIAKQMSADIQRRLRNNEYDGLASGRKFAGKLTEDMQAISKDKHLRVRFSVDPIPVRKERTKPTDEEVKQFMQRMKRRNFGFEKIEIMRGNIGYINLRGFMPAEAGAETVAAAMKFLEHTDILIFDLRRNGGGSPKMVALISSYLFGDEPVHLNSLYWRKGDRTDEFWTKPKKAAVKFTGKDVYILTSNRTFSAAEEFSYNLKNLKRAKIVGETTGGGAHPGGTFRLSKHFGAFISTGRAINPISKTNWEGTGVEPDVKVQKEHALNMAYLMGLESLVEKAGDERRKNALKGLIKEVKSKQGKRKKEKGK